MLNVLVILIRSYLGSDTTGLWFLQIRKRLVGKLAAT